MRLQVLWLNTTQQVAAQRDSTLVPPMVRNETLHPDVNGREVASQASVRTSERSDGAQRIAKTLQGSSAGVPSLVFIKAIKV